MEYSNEDAYLLMALRRGEMIAFDSIFKKYYPILCAYGNRFVDYEESKEIAGDAILWLWEHRETLQVETSLGRYLLKSVYHRSLNCIKQKQLKNHADTMYYEEMEKLIQDVYKRQESHPMSSGIVVGVDLCFCVHPIMTRPLYTGRLHRSAYRHGRGNSPHIAG